jgi:hypothetical protein
VTAEDVLTVADAMIAALAEVGVRLTRAQVDAILLPFALRAWPLLDDAAREQLGRPEGWDPLVREGGAIMLDDGRYWTGDDDHADGG